MIHDRKLGKEAFNDSQDTKDLLLSILNELKAIKIHLGFLTGELIDLEIEEDD